MDVRLLAAAAVPAAALLATPRSREVGPGDPDDAGGYRSGVLRVRPDVPGLAVRVAPDGRLVTLANGTGRTVVVHGYDGEPYLRVGPDGVAENARSVTAVLAAGGDLCALAGRRPARVVWRSVRPGTEVSWHDLRVRWSAPERPPAVAADPRRPHRVVRWVLPLTVDGSAVQVRGCVDWVGAPRVTAG